MQTKTLIANSERRLVCFKKQLELVNIDQTAFAKTCVLADWYKQLLRENKNNEQLWLKKMVEERRYANEGLNPPFCYRKP